MNFKVGNRVEFDQAFQEILNVISTKALRSDLDLYNLREVKSLDMKALQEGSIAFKSFIDVKNIVSGELSRKVQVDYKDLVLFFLLIKHIQEYNLSAKVVTGMYKLFNSLTMDTRKYLSDLRQEEYDSTDNIEFTDKLKKEIMGVACPNIFNKTDSIISILDVLSRKDYYTTICFIGFTYKQLYLLAKYLNNRNMKNLNKNIKILYIIFDHNLEDDKILKKYECFRVNSIQKYIDANHRKHLLYPLTNYAKNNHILISNKRRLQYSERMGLGILENVIEMGEL